MSWYYFIILTVLFSFSRHVQVTEEVRRYLRQPTFDNWQWDDTEMLILLRQMFIDLDLISQFNIEVNVPWPRPKFVY